MYITYVSNHYVAQLKLIQCYMSIISIKEISIRKKKRDNPIPIKQLLISPFSQPLATTNLLSVSIDLPIVDISYK